MKWNPHDNVRSVQVARVQVLLPSCHHDEYLSPPSATVRPSVIPAFSLVIFVASLVIFVASLVKPVSPPVIRAKAGIHRDSRSSPPTTTDLPDYV
jgi:hypothetical protein